MTKRLLIIAFTFASAFIFIACEKDDPVIPVEPEVITTLIYTLSPSDGGANIKLSFQDLDGDGGNDPTITGGTLNANSTYSGTLDLLNETEIPAESITQEIEEEDEEHQFFFQTNITNLTFAYNDQDGDGNPVGLSTTLTTAESGTGTITIILRHEPSKSATGVSGGDITNAGGETDIEVSFPIDVQ